MGTIVIDESRWPLVVVQWPDTEPDDAEIDRFIRESNARLARGELHTFLHDGLRAGGLSSRHRKMLAEHSRVREEELREFMVAAAIVTPSAIVRGVITAVNWLAPPVFPQRIFATREEANAWLEGEYARRVSPR